MRNIPRFPQQKQAFLGLGALQVAEHAPKVLQYITGASSIPELFAKAKAFTPTGRALAKAHTERALASGASAKILEMGQNMAALGIASQDAASLAKAYESSVKAQQAEHELARANSLLGRFSRSTAGQLSVPIIAMGAISGGALAAKKVMNVLGAAGINVDPSARLAAKVGLDRVLQAKPALASYPRDQLDQVYMSIFSHSPDLANDPYTMATTMERMLQMGGADTSVLRELSDYQSAVGQPAREQADLFQMGNSIFRR
jgi:hypothetical protein